MSASTIIRNLILCFGLCFFLAPVKAETISKVLYMEPNRPIFVQIRLAKNPNTERPTFFLLPGVNRSWLDSDAVAKTLVGQDFQYVTMNFSPHAFSVAQLGQSEIASFERRDFQIDDLVEEVKFVQQEIAKLYQLNNLALVTLSYSGLLSPYFADSVIIDTAPLTSAAAAYPDFTAYRQWIQSFELMNPILGPIWTRAQVDVHYRKHWSQKVDELITDYKLPKSKRLQMIEGMTSLSRAAEDQAWSLQKVAHQSRTLILGGKESPELLRDQLQLVKIQWANGNLVRVIFLPESGHVIPSQQPDLYVKILDKSSKIQSPEDLISQKKPSDILIIASSTDESEWTYMEIDEAIVWLQEKLANK